MDEDHMKTGVLGAAAAWPTPGTRPARRRALARRVRRGHLVAQDNRQAAQTTAGQAVLHTDLYELTMADAALADGTAHLPATFEAFARKLPPGAPYGVVAGIDRAIDEICAWHFDDAQLGYLEGLGAVSPRCLDWLAGFSFSGDIVAYPEGELWVPGSPLVTVTSTFAEGLLVETFLLSALNHGCAIATAAAGMRRAAGPKAKLVEMGSRRSHDAAAVDSAAYAWMAGFDSTSNLGAGALYGAPTAGTSAHAWVLAHEDETEAFVAQLRAQGPGTTLLVDTYDLLGGVRSAVCAANRLGLTGPAAVRIDSGDLTEEVGQVRGLLAELGSPGTKVTVSGDLGQEELARLSALDGAPDAFGVGTKLVSVAPVGAVYKLVAIGAATSPTGQWRPVSKSSTGKATCGGRKSSWRLRDDQGRVWAEAITPEDAPAPNGAQDAKVARDMVKAGRDVRGQTTKAARLAEARSRLGARLAELASATAPLEVVNQSAHGGTISAPPPGAQAAHHVSIVRPAVPGQGR